MILEHKMAKSFNMEMNIAKVIGIVAIVLGHTNYYNLFSNNLFPSYSWHVPLFFFISGYFFRNEIFECGNRLQKYFSKITHIIIRYFGRFYAYHFSYSIITLIVYLLFDRVYGELPTLINLTLRPFVETPFHFSAPNWFLFQLGFSLVVFYLILSIASKINKNPLFPLVVFLPLAICAIFLAKPDLQPTIGFTKILIKTSISMFYIYSGYLYKNILEDKIKFDIKTLLFVISIQVILYTFSQKGINVDLNQAILPRNIAPLITPFTGIYCILFLSKLIAPLVKPGTLIDKIGRNTLHIMANHLLIIFLIEISILAIDGKSIDMLPQYLIHSFYKMEKYKYLYTFLSVIICTYHGEILNYTGKIIKNKITYIKSKNQITQAPSEQLRDVPTAP